MDRPHGGEGQCTKIINLPFIILELLPFFIFQFVFCPEGNNNSIKASDLKLHRGIDFIMEKCSIQQLTTLNLCWIWRTLNGQTSFLWPNFIREASPGSTGSFMYKKTNQKKYNFSRIHIRNIQKDPGISDVYTNDGNLR